LKVPPRTAGAQNPQADFALQVSQAKLEDLGKRVLCEQNPKQELYKEVQFLPT